MNDIIEKERRKENNGYDVHISCVSTRIASRCTAFIEKLESFAKSLLD